MILDWVPAHFPRDDWALARFDGTALYEHADPRRGSHPDWGTLVFNFGRNEVRNFLIANALFWLREYHVDGIRVDAVASMLYLRLLARAGRVGPQRVRRPRGPRRGRVPARSSTRCSTPRARRRSRPPRSRRRGRASRGRPTSAASASASSGTWAGCTTRSATSQHDPIHRRYHHHELTFSLIYAFSENFILPLSHDEVVHGKGSLLAKMPGDRWQKLANLRALYGYMWAHPGKKLLFMGGEFAQEARVEPRALARLAPARAAPTTPASSRWCATSTAPTAPSRRCGSSTPSRPASAGSSPTTPTATCSRSCAPRDGAERLLVCVANLSPVAARAATASACRARAAGASCSTPTPRHYGGGDVGNGGGVERRADALARSAVLGAEVTLPPLAVLWLVPD